MLVFLPAPLKKLDVSLKRLWGSSKTLTLTELLLHTNSPYICFNTYVPNIPKPSRFYCFPA